MCLAGKHTRDTVIACMFQARHDDRKFPEGRCQEVAVA